MGVSWVLILQSMEGKTGSPHIMEVIHRRLVQRCPQKPADFSVENEVYLPVKGAGSSGMSLPCNVMSNSEYPVTCFALLEKGQKITADKLFTLLMLKMKGFYNQKTSLKTRCHGKRYQVGDFVVKVGSVSAQQSGSVLGTVLEVEYVPCAVSSMCHGLMKEFVLGLIGSSYELPTSVLQLSNYTATYDPTDTMSQYLHQFMTLQLKKSAEFTHSSVMGKIPTNGLYVLSAGEDALQPSPSSMVILPAPS